MTGVVKRFSDEKGYGFIAPDGGGQDVFVHQSVVQMEGFRTLRPGQKVDFQVEEGPKGMFANNVVVIP